MNYFITSRQDLNTSAIELAQVKRLRIFDHLNAPATIVTMLYNFDHQTIEEKLNVSDRVLNLYQFYQQLPYHADPTVDQSIIKQALTVRAAKLRTIVLCATAKYGFASTSATDGYTISTTLINMVLLIGGTFTIRDGGPILSILKIRDG